MTSFIIEFIYFMNFFLFCFWREVGTIKKSKKPNHNFDYESYELETGEKEDLR